MSYPVKDGAGNTILGGKTVAAGTFTATGDGSNIVPAPGMVGIQLTGTFVASVQLRKSFDDGATWRVIKTYTTPADEIYEELEPGVMFDLNCSAFTSGTVAYRLVGKA